MTMFPHSEYHLLRRAGKVPLDKGWIDNPLQAQAYNDHRAHGGDFGLVCGSRGIYVLDIDTDKATGEIRAETLELLLELELPETLKVTTPSGGCHYFFHSNEDLPGRSIKLAPGIDWLGKGGYVALYPPLEQYDPDMINGLPTSVLELIQKPERVPMMDLAVVEGSRNESLFKYGCALAGSGMQSKEIARAMWSENKLYTPPLERSEVRQIYDQVLQYVMEPEPIPQATWWESIDQVMALKLKPIDQLIGPLYSSAVYMFAGQAGVGKSFFSLQLAGRLAAGKDFQAWKTPKEQRVLYVDGEMAPQYMQARLATVPKSDNLKLMHLDIMRRNQSYTDLSSDTWRSFFIDAIDKFDVFFFDTVSSLLLAHKEGEMFSPEYWLQLEPFHQQFRAAGKTVIWVDNLNKSGEIFGTSVKHHKVDAVWNFNHWKEKPADATAGFTLDQGKLRGDTQRADGNWYFSAMGQWICA